jgi:hypothetical protein
MWAKRPQKRESCSFCDEDMPTSSATAITRPPYAPVMVMVIRQSLATLRPTCFMAQKARAPVIEAPRATSIETFSFTDHSACRSGKRDRVSRISVAGVPG